MDTLTKPFLLKVLAAYTTHPDQLTEQEQELAKRICTCAICDAVWMRRKKKLPTRCPYCHKYAWNRPLLEAIRVQTELQAGISNKPKENQQ